MASWAGILRVTKVGFRVCLLLLTFSKIQITLFDVFEAGAGQKIPWTKDPTLFLAGWTKDPTSF